MANGEKGHAGDNMNGATMNRLIQRHPGRRLWGADLISLRYQKGFLYSMAATKDEKIA